MVPLFPLRYECEKLSLYFACLANVAFGEIGKTFLDFRLSGYSPCWIFTGIFSLEILTGIFTGSSPHSLLTGVIPMILLSEIRSRDREFDLLPTGCRRKWSLFVWGAQLVIASHRTDQLEVQRRLSWTVFELPMSHQLLTSLGSRLWRCLDATIEAKGAE